MLRHGSLFSGIGGFDLAAEWMGWENIFHCEWNPFGQKVLKHYWPNAKSYNDITKTDFTIHRGNIDILTGGFPCQPYSVAGKQLGTEDDRHLWPEMLRAIREIAPTFVVGENVPGLVNWSGGLVFEQVQTDLEAEGYKVQPIIIPACGINAPHRRDRIWFIAHSENSRCGGRKNQQCADGKRELLQGESAGCQMGDKIKGCSREWTSADSNGITSNTERNDDFREKSGSYGPTENMEGINREEHSTAGKFSGTNKLNDERNESIKYDNADSNNERIQGRETSGNTKTERPFCEQFTRGHYQRNDWNEFPTVPPLCIRDDGFSSRLDNISFPKWRNESIKAGGNAIVPQVAFEIFKAIQASIAE